MNPRWKHRPEGSTWGDFGPDDQIGRLNLLTPEKVKQAFRILKKAKPKVILMNIFGGITRCDTVAQGVHEVVKTEGAGAPVVARIKGWYEEKAREILKDAGMVTASTMEEAARIATGLVGGG